MNHDVMNQNEIKVAHRILGEVATMAHDELMLKHEPVVEFMKSRGISPATAQYFQLGVFGSENEVNNKYDSHDFIIARLIGLIKGDDVDYFYDLFQKRIGIPIHDIDSNCVGFIARTFPPFLSYQKNGKEIELVKYINSSSSTVFTKGNHLYNFNRVKDMVKQENKVILCEGPFDVMALHKAGYPYAVASMGTALTHEQVDLIKEYTDRVIICYDGDDAGLKATERANTLLSNAGIKVRVMRLTKGDDIDSYIQKTGSCKAIYQHQEAYSKWSFQNIIFKYANENGVITLRDFNAYMYESFDQVLNMTKETRNKALAMMSVVMDTHPDNIIKDFVDYASKGGPF